MFFVADWVRRRLALREPFPESWRIVLRRRAPFYLRFDADERARFEDKLKLFVREKHFEGARGMRITDEVKVTIGACAARLVMNMKGEHYARLREVVVYPFHFKHPDGEGPVMLGQAHGPGVVVLSYPAVLAGLARPHDGHDTAVHEFAHALDAGDGGFDGTPELASLEAYAPWAKHMSAAFQRLAAKRRFTSADVLREYAVTNEAEFFAVATEAFFERPHDLHRRHPHVYDVLSDYYRADPASLRGRKASPPSS